MNLKLEGWLEYSTRVCLSSSEETPFSVLLWKCSRVSFQFFRLFSFALWLSLTLVTDSVKLFNVSWKCWRSLAAVTPAETLRPNEKSSARSELISKVESAFVTFAASAHTRWSASHTGVRIHGRKLGCESTELDAACVRLISFDTLRKTHASGDETFFRFLFHFRRFAWVSSSAGGDSKWLEEPKLYSHRFYPPAVWWIGVK